MKLISPFTILRAALNSNALESPNCFIDDTQVALKECGVPIEENTESTKSDFWEEECKDHPTNSHCKDFDE